MAVGVTIQNDLYIYIYAIPVLNTSLDDTDAEFPLEARLVYADR